MKHHFEDLGLAVSPTEIRGKNFTLLTNSISGVTLLSHSMLAISPLWLLIPMIPYGLLMFFVSGLLGIGFLVMLAPMAFLLLFAMVIRSLTVMKVILQTAGGPVIIACAIKMFNADVTLSRFEELRDAVEGAMKDRAAAKV